MEYAQLNEAGTDALQITSHGPIEWDANNYCTAAALVKDGKAEQFRVVLLIETRQPEIDQATQTVFRDGCELIDGLWQYKWTVRDLTPEEIEARYQASIPKEVSALACLAAINEFGKAADYTLWATSPDRTFMEEAFIKKATIWKYDNEALNAACISLNISDQQKAAMFIRAKELEALL